MTKVRFDEEVSRSYDESSAEMFRPEVLGPTVDFLAGLAGDGVALELAVGTGRVALPLSERGIRVCAPVHDALLVEGPADQIDKVVQRTQAAMAEAGRIVLDGFELRSDAEIFIWPNRYMDKRGAKMWHTVLDIANKVSQTVG